MAWHGMGMGWLAGWLAGRARETHRREEKIKQDIKYILNIWKQIQKKYNKGNIKSPSLIYKSPDIAEKIIIDTFSNDLKKIIVNNKIENDRKE